nr:hypothetical protein [uncultured Shinella sp.]
MLPVAVLGLLATPNEYRAMGVDAIDCDGPISVLIFAVPALVVYAIASMMFLRRFRRLGSFFPGVICGLICVGLIWNIGNAAQERWKSSDAQDCGTGL